MRRSRRTATFLSNPRAVLVAAAVFHIVVTLGVFSIGRLGVFPQQIGPAGIGQFASDGYYFLPLTDSLANILVHEGVSAWLRNPAQIHVKLHSLSFVLMRPLLGSNILTSEPVNLSCYLGILVLTFSLAKQVAGQRAALVASAIVALWPSLLLHTTQLLRDPLLIAATLALILILTNLLTKVYNWAKGLALALAGSVASVVILMTRSEIWLVVRTTVVAALVLFVIRTLREKKLLAGNLAGIALLGAVTSFVLPIPGFIQREFGVSVGVQIRDADLPLWFRIANRRQGFISDSSGQSGSTIDSEIAFASEGDVVRYIPRAVEIGSFAPFPKMWFSAGHNVGLIGRLLSGFETTLTYAIELLAAIFVWRNRRSLHVWLLVIAAVLGILALGLVVVNVGTLYRMRYSYWVLLVILSSGGLFEIVWSRIRSGKVVDSP
jgi:hypothetical protein